MVERKFQMAGTAQAKVWSLYRARYFPDTVRRAGWPEQRSTERDSSNEKGRLQPG